MHIWDDLIPYLTASGRRAVTFDFLGFGVPVKLIWGKYDPYFTVAMAERRPSQLKHATLTVVPAGRWLQVDEPRLMAEAMLSEVLATAGA